jgi:ATP synthase protein I
VVDERRQREQRLVRRVGQRERRKLRARGHADRTVWFGIGMYGLIGWSIAIPTVAGVALGIWVDRTYPGRFSWTLMLLAAGLLLGCWTAWYWVAREQREIGDLDRRSDDRHDHD